VRHGQGVSLGFADGHSEHWKWKSLNAELAANGSATTPVNSVNDLIRLQNAVYVP
jgi:prepilin-type processing-associated H-X9-DG protein